MTSKHSLVVVLGPSAVGKMTVGQELARQTGMPLLFNHMVVDLVTAIAPFGTPAFHRLARRFTADLLDAAAEAERGLILTHALIFDRGNAAEMLRGFSAPFLARSGEACFAELSAPLDVRLARNKTENRRQHKNTDWATPERLTEMESWGSWLAGDDFVFPGRHIRIENSDVSASDAASLIRDAFAL